MNKGWDQAKGLADKHTSSGSGLFVRLAGDRDKVVGAFAGDPYARETHWTGERYEVCTGDGCSICSEGKRPNLRVSMNFYVPAERDLKIIEGGVTWFKDLLKARDKYGLDKCGSPKYSLYQLLSGPRARDLQRGLNLET